MSSTGCEQDLAVPSGLRCKLERLHQLDNRVASRHLALDRAA
jgi:hypothetical protein